MLSRARVPRRGAAPWADLRPPSTQHISPRGRLSRSLTHMDTVALGGAARQGRVDAYGRSPPTCSAGPAAASQEQHLWAPAVG